MADKPKNTERRKYLMHYIERQLIVEFIECCIKAGIVLADYGEYGDQAILRPTKRILSNIISEHQGIDVKKLEEEDAEWEKYEKGVK